MIAEPYSVSNRRGNGAVVSQWWLTKPTSRKLPNSSWDVPYGPSLAIRMARPYGQADIATAFGH